MRAWRSSAESLKASPDRAANVGDRLLAPAFRAVACGPSRRWLTPRSVSLQIRRATPLPRTSCSAPRPFAEELRRARRGLARGHGRRVPDHGDRASTARRGSPDRGALRHRGPGPEAWRAERVGALEPALAPRRGRRLARPRVDGVRASAEPRRGPRLRRGHEGRPRRKRLLPPPARPRPSTPGCATIDSGLTRDSNGHHGVSVGDADGDGLDDLYVAQPAGPAEPALPGPGRRHLRGRDGARGPGRPRRHLAVALRRRGQRRRPGPGPSLERGAGAVPERRHGPLHARPRRLPLPGGAAGLAHVDGDGRLRPRRLPRPLPLRLFLLLRRGRGQGGHAHALLRRPERPARASSSGTTATAVSSTSPARPASRRATTATTSPPPGATTTATAGPTCWWPTTSGGRTSTTTAGCATER